MNTTIHAITKKQVLVGLLAAAIILVIAIGCDADLVWPHLTDVAVVVDGKTVSNLTPSKGSDTTIQDDLPTTGSVVLTFNEPLELTSAKEKIAVRDSLGNPVAILITQRLSTIAVAAQSGSFVPGQNYVLSVDDGIKDTSGRHTKLSYQVNFYVAQ